MKTYLREIIFRLKNGVSIDFKEVEKRSKTCMHYDMWNFIKSDIGSCCQGDHANHTIKCKKCGIQYEGSSGLSSYIEKNTVKSRKYPIVYITRTKKEII